jgi:hypothetical protein
MVVVDEKVAAVVAGNRWGGVTGNVLHQTMRVIPHHLRNVAPLLLDLDHPDADLRRAQLVYDDLADVRHVGSPWRAFKPECHYCDVPSELNKPAEPPE